MGVEKTSECNSHRSGVPSVKNCENYGAQRPTCLRHEFTVCNTKNIDFYGAETWALRAVDQKRLESFEMWCWRRMEKISWTDHVRN